MMYIMLWNTRRDGVENMKTKIVKKMVMLGRAGGQTREALLAQLTGQQIDPAILAEALEETFSLSDEKFQEIKDGLRKTC